MEKLYPLCLLAFLLAVPGCAFSPLAKYERSLVYQPMKIREREWPEATALGAEEAKFTSKDGTKLHGWFFDHPERRAVVLFTHGNGGNVAMWANSTKYLVDRHRVAALVFDYRGYGQSEGQPHEKGILADARAARKWLAERTGVAEESIVLMGQSLGGGVAVDLAAKDGARGLVLVSTFTSVPAVASEHMPWLPASWVMTERFNSLEKIKKYHGPLLICHGDADRVIPFEQGEALYTASKSQHKKFIRHAGGNHNDPPPEEYRAALDVFLDGLPKEKELGWRWKDGLVPVPSEPNGGTTVGNISLNDW
jgi:fermentation-respiration switch protein FrsA (DUF1100 family)